ncbi:MAG: hypothetical protein AAF757_31665 [Cyanobacteria bacterium P01_D01_bin.116]
MSNFSRQRSAEGRVGERKFKSFRYKGQRYYLILVWILDYKIYQLPITNYQLPIPNYQLPIT